MISGDSFSRVSITCPHEKVDTPKPRDFRSHACGPQRESTFGSVHYAKIKETLQLGKRAMQMNLHLHRLPVFAHGPMCFNYHNSRVIEKQDYAMRATSAYSRCQPIPWVLQGYV
ncbi:hypothetical protein CRG98_002960 [Punica granatum]|uniref:Uncharacterized protein n=1 Tax=Punica granatum TaxID=22663 RepID=A0A2I0L7I4_PUNGR|nr:hypothetical protein CRG98_002960 [Punica granatum]